MLLALAVGSLILQGTIDYETKAKRLDLILADLSTQTGLSLSANLPINREIVVLSVHGKPLDEVISRIAAVTSSRAERTGKGWKLVVDPKARDAAAKRAFDDRVAKITEAQRALLARLDEEGPFDAKAIVKRANDFEARFGDRMVGQEAHTAGVALRLGAPGSRPLRKLVASMDPAVLARIPEGGAAVFSNQPRAMQWRLGSEAKAAIEETAREQAEWLNTYRSDGSFERKEMTLTGDPRSGTEPIDPAKIRLVLRVDASSYGQLPGFMGFFAESDGNSLITPVVNLESDVKPEPKPPQSPDKSPADDEPEILLSDAAKAHTLGLSTLTWKRKADPAGPEMRKIILDPLKYDPFGFALSEGLLQSARAGKTDLVACLPDNSLDSLASMIDPNGEWQPLRPSGFLKGLRGTSHESDPRWLSVRPTGTAPRCDRDALARFLRDVDRVGCIRLDSYADFTLAAGAASEVSLVRHLVDSLLPGATATNGSPNAGSLRLYALLPAPIRQRLRKGDPIRIGDLSKDVRIELQNTVFYRQTQNLRVTRPKASVLRGRFLSILNEPTEALPDGISEDGTLMIQVSPSPAAFADNEINGWGRVLPLSSLANQILMPEFPRLRASDQLGGGKLGTIRPGRQETLNLMWQLTPNASWIQVIQDNQFNLRSPRQSFESLTGDWKKEIDEAVAYRRKQELEEDKQSGRNQSTGIPPPR